MNILAFCTSWWDNDSDRAKRLSPVLEEWLERVTYHFNPVQTIIATGCQENPQLNPLADKAVTVSAGIGKTRGYDPIWWCYWLGSVEAAFLYALNRATTPWDLLVLLEEDCFIKPGIMPDLLEEFQKLDEIIMAPAWSDGVEVNFMVLKRPAAHVFLNNRKRPNLVNPNEPAPMLVEVEFQNIFQGAWWNPWPDLKIMRQNYGALHGSDPLVPDDIAKNWPLVICPTPETRQMFAITK